MPALLSLLLCPAPLFTLTVVSPNIFSWLTIGLSNCNSTISSESFLPVNCCWQMLCMVHKSVFTCNICSLAWTIVNVCGSCIGPFTVAVTFSVTPAYHTFNHGPRSYLSSYNFAPPSPPSYTYLLGAPLCRRF